MLMNVYIHCELLKAVIINTNYMEKIFLNKFHSVDGTEAEKFEHCFGSAFTQQTDRLQVYHQANLIIFINLMYASEFFDAWLDG